jgi:hypothetical protein
VASQSTKPCASAGRRRIGWRSPSGTVSG